MRKLLSILLIGGACLSGAMHAFGQGLIQGNVVEADSGDAVAGAVVTVPGNRSVWVVTDSLGRFSLRSGATRLEISCLGYLKLECPVRKDRMYRLVMASYAIQEVVITATENHGLTCTSRIGEDAIAHIQPSSFADLLELLPGGRSIDPAFAKPQTINLRAAGVSDGNYNTSSLGTRFLVDGIPVNNDANLQNTPSFSAFGSSFVNAGVDMRTLATEDIETVEIVRGIPSVEHGDLTSGLVDIKRRRGGHAIRARFKADMTSKLFYFGKDLEWGKADKLTLNASLNYLDSRADPRNTRQNYTRLTGSLRCGKTWTRNLLCTLNGSFDYTGSFDRQKSDKDLDFGDNGPVETYRSDYNRLASGLDFSARTRYAGTFFQSVNLSVSMTYEQDLIDRWKFVELGAPTPLSTSVMEGEWDVQIVPYNYEAALQVDGRPFYSYFNAVVKFRKEHGSLTHHLKAGTQWTLDKNFGRGVLFDPEHPFSVDMNVRPRNYAAIPASVQGALFAEYNSLWKIGAGWQGECLLGLRTSTMHGPGRNYSVQDRLYFDPRANVRMQKSWSGGTVGLSGGVGWHTKFPTMNQLHPDPLYADIVQLNYWPVEENLRRINVHVLRIDPVNFALGAARNFKWEIAADLRLGKDFSFSVDYFQEDMKSGFRNSTDFTRLIYKDYQEETIDKSTLFGPPSLEATPWAPDTLLVGYSFHTNGSRTLKEGIEFTLSTPRIKPLKTKITVNGAWFATRYTNSQPEYYRPSVVVAGKTYPYVGCYEEQDGYLREVLNTNILFDSQIPRLGMIFSTSFQCQWFTGRQNMPRNPRPVYYIDKQLESHPFTDASASNGVMRLMIRAFTPEMSRYFRVPFCMSINLKATKKLYYDKIACALFVNRILDVSPNYRTNYGILVRRSVLPYFGMELNFKL